MDCQGINCYNWSDNQGFCFCCGKPVNSEYFSVYIGMYDKQFTEEFKSIWREECERWNADHPNDTVTP